MPMTFAEYQRLAMRTKNYELAPRAQLEHATWGLIAEVGEVCGLFQKTHQGHEIDEGALFKEIGDCLWMLAELCDVYGFDMDEVARANINKLRKRYPDGFSADKSMHRAQGDT